MVDPHHNVRLLLALVPAEVRKSISAEELADRVAESARLSSQANDPALSAELRQGARLRAQAIMRAQPRGETLARRSELIAKAAAAPAREDAEALRRQAGLLDELHPVAPQRGAAVMKAKTDDPIAVFDAGGNLIGICDPDDITPVGSPGGGEAPQPPDSADVASQDPALDGQVVKGSAGKVIVRDQFGRRYVTDRRSIRNSARGAVRKAGDDLVTLHDAIGREYQVPRSALQSPEVQARNTGPVNAGGTTGMGRPRVTGPAASLPFDGPQRARPGDVPDRQVVKAGSAGPGRVQTVGDVSRNRRLARIAKATGVDLSGLHPFARNPFSAEAHCVCEAPAAHRTHTEIAPGVPVDPRRVAKSSWSPRMANQATEQWLAAQRRR